MEVGNMAVVKIEEIANVVGMDSYLASLSLDEKQLKMIEVTPENQDLKFTYHYDSLTIQFVLTRKKEVKLKTCSCLQPNCGHLALALKHAFSQFDTLSFPKEEDRFQELLFRTLKTKKKKREIELEVELKQISTAPIYELNLKIGTDKKYTLKKVLIPFLLNYQKPNYEITLGKYFTYDTNQYCFSKQDEEILHFTKLYIELKEQGGLSSFYQSSSNIILKGDLLATFLGLLKGKAFTLVTAREILPHIQIQEQFQLPITVKKEKDAFTLRFPVSSIEPILSDYTYFLYQRSCYHVSKKTALFLKTMVENEREDVTITKAFYKEFANEFLELCTSLSEEVQDALKDHFSFDKPHYKMYFEKREDDIVSFVKAQYSKEEINILSPRNYIQDIYVTRLLEQEEQMIQDLNRYGFQTLPKKGIFVLKDPELSCAFLQTGLYQLAKKYDIYVSNQLKKTKIHKKTSVKNTFQIGTDGIMSYQFSIDGIDPEEVTTLLKSLQQKKKFYKMKSGDYLSLEGNEGLQSVLETQKKLAIPLQAMGEGSVVIPKYQSLKLLSFSGMDYYQVDQNIQKLVQQFEDYKDRKIQFTEEENKVLRAYQKVGVQWMYTISECEFGGILADEMGLGKSIQTITYMRHRFLEQKDPEMKMLIVVPTSLIYNWKEEFQKFGKDLKITIVNDTRAKRVQKLQEKSQVYITSYGLLRQDIDLYQEMSFDTMVLDEAQNIKNPKSDTTLATKAVKARVKFALTGTPLENSIYELWSIMDFIMPGYLGDLNTFRETFGDENDYTELNHQIRPFILRRRKKDVLKDLPDKLENRVYVELSEEQKALYLSELEKAKKEIHSLEEQGTVSQNQFFILSLLTRLRQICIDPNLIFENYHEVSSKFITLLQIVEELIQNHHKILIFSQFPSALRNLIPLLDGRKITYHYLDGATKAEERLNMVHQFHEDDVPVFLISLKAGGTGLNLTCADEVIHLDPWWNPQVENQATDRTHRIGQTHTVEVLKFIATGTIEEKIIELQEKKKALSDQIIEGKERGELVLSKLTSEELLQLFQ